MDQTTVFLTIVGMAVVTYLPRVLPVWFLSRLTLPSIVISWLSYVPVAVLAAMLFPALLIQEQRINLTFDNLFFWAAIPTVVVAWKTRSFFSTVLVGMALVALGRYLGA
jgi:branched-subunit amino acid transport protein